MEESLEMTTTDHALRFRCYDKPFALNKLRLSRDAYKKRKKFEFVFIGKWSLVRIEQRGP